MTTEKALLDCLSADQVYKLLAEITDDLKISPPHEGSENFYLLRISSAVRSNKIRADQGDALAVQLENFIRRNG